MKTILIATTLVQSILVVHAHYAFTTLIHNNITFSHWRYIRKWGLSDRSFNQFGDDYSPYEIHWPVSKRPLGWENSGVWIPPKDEDLRFNSTEFRCNVNSTTATETLTVRAGDEVGFWVGVPDPIEYIYHDGPLTAWLGRVPANKTAQTWEGDGQAWFKIHEDFPEWFNNTYTENNITYSSIVPRWPNLLQSNPIFRIPPATPEGEYLLRIEQLGMHDSAIWNQGPQFYLSCAQIRIARSESTSNSTPAPLVTIPGHYDIDDPIMFAPNIYAEYDLYKGAKKSDWWRRTMGPAMWKG